MNCKHGRFTERHCEDCEREAKYFEDLVELVGSLAKSLRMYVPKDSGILLDAKELLEKVKSGGSP